MSGSLSFAAFSLKSTGDIAPLTNYTVVAPQNSGDLTSAEMQPIEKSCEVSFYLQVLVCSSWLSIK